MKLTKTRLKQLIKEELNKALKEFEYKYAPEWGQYEAQVAIDKAIDAVEEEYKKLEERMKEELAIQVWQKQLLDGIKISDKELKDYLFTDRQIAHD